MGSKNNSYFLTALRDGQFVPYFQPQFNYETDAITGVEVLTRWVKPDGFVISPGSFIAEFERTGFIYEMDKYIWDTACATFASWKAKGYAIPSISVNVSRYDLYHSDMADYLLGLLSRHGLALRDVHLEVTESAYSDDTTQFLDSLGNLRRRGFVIEMDDFGSGYSSLCALKEMPVEVIKLDGDFLSEEDCFHRCGKIILSVVNMAHSIDIAVVAEGVETREQADFLKSVGCRYMQGFLFSKPMTADDFENAFCRNTYRFSSVELPGRESGESIDFFDIESQNTLIFNSFVGGAAILTRDQTGTVRAVRMNDMFYRMVGIPRDEYMKRQYDFLAGFDAESAEAFTDALDVAASTGGEASCMTLSPDIDSKGRAFWSHNRLRLIARKVELEIFYLSIEDITERVELSSRNEELLKAIEEREDIFMNAAEQVNMFFWKYDIKTKEMFPCFRCQKYLSLPQKVENYPQPAIDTCIFPEGPHYKEVMERVDRGEDIDEIMPLTCERVPFRVRYTVKRDKDGNPSVAYATALPVSE